MAPERIISRPVRKPRYSSVLTALPNVTWHEENPTDKDQQDGADDSTTCDECSAGTSVATQDTDPKEGYYNAWNTKEARVEKDIEACHSQASDQRKEMNRSEETDMSRSHSQVSVNRSCSQASSGMNHSYSTMSTISREIRQGDIVRLKSKALRGAVQKMTGEDSCLVVFDEAKHLGPVSCRTADLKVLRSK
jgi:hypothetical protein